MADPSYLADTNILLRMSKRRDPTYAQVRTALRALRSKGARLRFTSQNLAEFWNVCTRPADQNGFGLSIAETNQRAQLIESTFTLLPDNEQIHGEWRRLVVTHSVVGVKVHDARLVAAMHIHGVPHLLSLDAHDFARYPGITVIHPREISAAR
jgi:predicted nucleic acid-binding protein